MENKGEKNKATARGNIFFTFDFWVAYCSVRFFQNPLHPFYLCRYFEMMSFCQSARISPDVEGSNMSCRFSCEPIMSSAILRLTFSTHSCQAGWSHAMLYMSLLTRHTFPRVCWLTINKKKKKQETEKKQQVAHLRFDQIRQRSKDHGL